MHFLDKLSFGFGKKLPLLLQTEAAECGLACLGMIACYHGYNTDLASLRQRFPISLKGATLVSLIQIANRLQMTTRPLKLELEHLNQLRLPCILHWNFNHFVVLKEVGPKSITIHDPGFGQRTLSMNDVSAAFTGVALEVWPAPEFKPQVQKQPIRLRELMGNVTGLAQSFGQILLLALALEVFSLVSPFFLQWVVDNVIVSADRDLLTTLALGFGLLMILQQAVGGIRSWVIMYMSTTLNLQWRGNVFTHLIRLPVSYFEKRHLGDVVSRFGTIDIIQRTLTTSFMEAVLDGLMTIITLVLMLLYSPGLSLVALVAMGLYGLGRWAWYQPLRHATEEQIIHAAKQQSHFLETIRGVKVIKLFQRQDERRSSWLSLLVDQINADLRTQKLQLLFKQINGLLFGLENIIIIWLGAKLVLDGNFSVGVLLAFNAYKSQFDTRVGSLIDKIYEVRMLQLQGERLADIVLTEPEALHGQTDLLNERELEPRLEVKNLRFRYAEQEPWVLNGINMTINAGESVAIIGPSGCGKTTLLNVLLGILPPSEGDVLVGDVSLKQAGVDVLRHMVGTVLQDDVLFAGSIEENISFFDPHANAEWVAQCATMAAIAPDINAMPMGYKTLVGDMGTVLSGGQKQRILLARALYKKPKILFLDEATSHLDVAREQEVNEVIKSLNMTRIIVAHRRETIASADRVIRLRAGKVAADTPTTPPTAPPTVPPPPTASTGNPEPAQAGDNPAPAPTTEAPESGAATHQV
jgi:ATP-binding cassette subfamily B protein RaxB